MTYQRRHYEVEAWEWMYDKGQDAAPPWVTDALFRWPGPSSLAFEPENEGGARIRVTTPQGIADADPGDWIVMHRNDSKAEIELFAYTDKASQEMFEKATEKT